MPCELDAFFLPCSGGRRCFCLLRRPPGKSRGGILYIHPFAEEVNKSRRMAALGATALAEAGWSVLQMDLAGCGDSDGEFEEASWEVWLEDLTLAAAWLRRDASGPLWLWGLRIGALMASQLASRIPDVDGLLLWQPADSGRQCLSRFLRLACVRDVLESGAGATTSASLQAALRAGLAREVAGYVLSPTLATGLEGADWKIPPPSVQVVCLEVGASPAAALSPALARRVEGWRAAGVPVRAEALAGPAFWQTQEIETCPALPLRSVALLEGAP